MLDKIKIGIIGIGQIGKIYLNRYKDIPGAEIVAAADINSTELDRVAEEFDIPHTYSDYRELLKRDDLSDWIKKYEGRVCSLHVSDRDANGITGVGEGSCRAEDAIRSALDTGVETFIMEVRLENDALEDVRRDVDFTRQLIG